MFNFQHTIDSTDKSDESQDENYSCDMCDASFDEGDDLETHIELIHEDNAGEVYKALHFPSVCMYVCMLLFLFVRSYVRPPPSLIVCSGKN